MAKVLDLSGRGPSNRTLLLSGVAVIAASAAIISLLLDKSSGRFDSYTRIVAELTNVGDGLPNRSDVRYHGLLVGSVDNVVPTRNDEPNMVHIDIAGDYAQAIPKTVTARVVPSSVFAISGVELIDNGAAPAIQTGDRIAEDTKLPTVLFQTTISKLRDILFATGRGREDETLGILAALGAATHDRRPQLLTAGAQLDRIVNELNSVVATDTTSPSTLSALVAAAEGLQQTAPDLLDSLHQAVGPMQAIVEQRAQLDTMLAGGTRTLDTAHSALANHVDQMITISKHMTPVMGVLAQTSNNWVPAFQKAKVFSEKFPQGWDPEQDVFRLRVNLSLTPSYSYTRADCPSYGALKGPSCFTAPLIAVRPELPDVLLPQNYQPPPDLLPPPGTVVGPSGNLIAVGPPLINPQGPNLVDPNPPLSDGIGTGVLGGVGPPMTPAPPVPGTANPALTTPPVPLNPSPAPLAPVAPWPPGYLPGEAAPASYGGNVGPVGSAQEVEQLSYITGRPATAATQLLLAPVVRGMTVTEVTGGQH
jgi:ABC-type transporter Mla subunit MlaD